MGITKLYPNLERTAMIKNIDSFEWLPNCSKSVVFLQCALSCTPSKDAAYRQGGSENGGRILRIDIGRDSRRASHHGITSSRHP